MNERSSTARFFLALWPGEGELDAVSKWQHSIDWPSAVRLTPRQKVHATLHFIGQLPAERLPELIEALTVPAHPVQIDFDQLEQWGGGLTVLTASRMPAELLDLHARLRDRLLALGLPVEARPYRPHVTLARDAGRSLPSRPHGRTLHGVAWRSNGYVLVESARGRYKILACYGHEPSR